MAGKVKLTERAKLYLRSVPDWSAVWEIRPRLGDTPPAAGNDIRRMLGRLSARGLVEWHSGNNTYRITEAGRRASSGKDD